MTETPVEKKAASSFAGEVSQDSCGSVLEATSQPNVASVLGTGVLVDP